MPQMVTASANHTLDVLLELVCVSIQLTKTQEKLAAERYASVTDWLNEPDSPVRPYMPHIFPQGSLRLGTTSKPIKDADFDLDVVCLLNARPGCHPGDLYRLVWDRMATNGKYRPMMIRLPRCIRLDYSGNFHLDIVPALPDSTKGVDCILVPDLDANLALDHPKNDRWKSSNPTGYAKWFENRCARSTITERYAQSKVDPLPSPQPIHEKPALKRSVQLLKRWRDLEYEDRPHLSPPSIILTTLSAHLYCGGWLCADVLRTIVNQIVAKVENGKPIRLTNPANQSENICEKWEQTPKSYHDFCNAVTAFRDRWERLITTRGLDDIQETLAELFGEGPVRFAIKELANRNVVRPRQDGRLHFATGLGAIGAATSSRRTSVPPNNFFGNSHEIGESNRSA
jgi:hypothetical protein